MGIYRGRIEDNGKEHGNQNSILGLYRDYIMIEGLRQTALGVTNMIPIKPVGAES